MMKRTMRALSLALVALMLVSAAIPFIYFKRKGWL